MAKQSEEAADAVARRVRDVRASGVDCIGKREGKPNQRSVHNELSLPVHERLTNIFRRYGLPWRMVMDNDSPWSGGELMCPHSSLTVWQLRLGVRVSHGRPYHPQTQGKDERFHRTLKA